MSDDMDLKSYALLRAMKDDMPAHERATLILGLTIRSGIQKQMTEQEIETLISNVAKGMEVHRQWAEGGDV